MDLKQDILKGYLKTFFVKPDMSPTLWKAAKACLDNTKSSFYAIRFNDDLSMRQFVMAVLLSSGTQFHWQEVKSYQLVQDSLDGSRLLTDYIDLDLLFIPHQRGSLKNSILGQSINQVSILRAPKKTFFFDMGGYPLQDLIVPVLSINELLGSVSKAISKGDDL